MDMMFYSPTTRGFYDSADAQADAKPISIELYRSLLGLQIVPDENGMPSVYVPPEPTHPELVEKAKAATRIQRQPIIDMLTGLQASAVAKQDFARAQVIETAKQGLRDITQTDLSACTTYEEMRLAVKAAYIGLAMALPSDVRVSFSDALK